MPDCDPDQQRNTRNQLEEWYLADGRDDPTHPMHCLFTGLAMKYRKQEDAE